MKKVRVYELSRHTNVPSKELIKIFKELNMVEKSHMSALEDNEVNIVLEFLTQIHMVDDTTQNEIFNLNQDKNLETDEENQNNENLSSLNSIEEKDCKVKNISKNEIHESIKSTENFEKSGIGKNVIIVDTRANDLEIDKLYTEKIEELVPGNINEEVKKIEKIKKTQKIRKTKEEIAPSHVKKEIKKEYFEVRIPGEIVVSELSEKIDKPIGEIIKTLMSFGVMATINQSIDFDTASMIAEDFGGKAILEIITTEEEELFNDLPDKSENLKKRSPIVTVMGHVDHGKTSLLDTIRKTNVTQREFGGITQHIGAYRVYEKGQRITFLDTPGHEAFTEMRARGALVTDIAILVVAADDGIMPQTIEAINHAKEAKVSIIVAINKIDKENSNPEKIKQELTEHGLIPEEWGGNTICVEISAKNNINIDKLLEMILLVAEMKELKSNPNRKANGTVIESYLDKGRGPVSTFLIKNGTLRTGDIVITGITVGKIRTMINDKGKILRKAGPSVPVEVIGLPNVCECGDLFYVIEDEKRAKQIAEKRRISLKQEKYCTKINISLDNLFEHIESGKMKELNIIIKADVQGSAEAIKHSFERITNEEVGIKVIHSAVGAINESDIMLASASNAIIVGFNVRPTSRASSAAAFANVDIKLYRVIYDATQDIEKAIKGMLTPIFKEITNGHAEIRNIFKVSGIGTIGGAYVMDGKIQKTNQIRVLRNGTVIHDGILASLKRFKNDTKEVTQGYECGLSIEKFNDIKIGDVIESFVMEKQAIE
jgi:translation initiation factor IF-2